MRGKISLVKVFSNRLINCCIAVQSHKNQAFRLTSKRELTESKVYLITPTNTLTFRDTVECSAIKQYFTNFTG